MNSQQINAAREASARLQEEYKRGKQKQEKKKGGWWWLVVLLLLLIPRLLENGEVWLKLRQLRAYIYRYTGLGRQLLLWEIKYGIQPGTLATVLMVAVPILAFLLAVRFAKRARGQKEDSSFTRRDADRVSAAGRARTDWTGRVSAAVQRKDPRTKSFTQPDPYCVVCDHTGEDHFQHDKAERIKQLNEWLKNGLIDREEYKVLKSRYERDL